MKLLSINVSLPQAVERDGRVYQTGIYKQHVMGRVRLRRLGLDGDGQADRDAHGGPNRAVYCYGHENYRYWTAQLAWDDVQYGQFGENLTTLGLLETDVCIGDVFRIGAALIQVTQPRVPCYKLADKLGIPGFEKTFLRANRPGFYARALEAGWVEAADAISLIQRDPAGMSVAEVNAALYLEKDADAAKRAAQIEALSPEWRRACEKLAARA